MITIEKLMILKDVDIFRYTPDDVLLDIAYSLEEQVVLPGEDIVKEGDVGDTMYIIVHGKVKVHEKEKFLAELGVRQVFGELAALSPEVRIATVSALENTLLFKIRRGMLYEMMERHIGLAKGIIEALCQRMREIAREKTRTLV